MAASLNNLTTELSTVISDTEETGRSLGQVPSERHSGAPDPVSATESHPSKSKTEEIFLDSEAAVVGQVLDYLRSLQGSHSANKIQLDTEGETTKITDFGVSCNCDHILLVQQQVK